MRQYVPTDSMIDVTLNGFQHDADVYVLAQDIPRWIPVTERLPEVGQRVLGFWMSHRGAVQSVRGAVGGWLDDDGAVTTPPSHWMPLPAPPVESLAD